jgi:hypothetical protein
MMERAKILSAGSARHVYLHSMLGYSVLAIVMKTLSSLGNKSTVPGEKLYDPVFGIFLASAVTIGFVAITCYHFARTDEHDRIVNLWAFALAFLTYFVVVIPWGILSQSGILGPVIPNQAMLIAASVGCIVWTWLRFR